MRKPVRYYLAANVETTRLFTYRAELLAQPELPGVRENAIGFVPALNCAALVLDMLVNGHSVSTGAFINNAVSWTIDTLDELCNTAVSNFVAFVLPNLASNLSLIGAKATDITSETGPVGNFNPGTPPTGGDSAPSTSNNCAACIKVETGNRGRSYRGRNFMPGLPTDEVEGNLIDIDWLDDLITTYGSYMNSMNGDGMTPVVLSRVSDGVARPEAIQTPVLSYTATNNLVTSQRDRVHDVHR